MFRTLNASARIWSVNSRGREKSLNKETWAVVYPGPYTGLRGAVPNVWPACNLVKAAVLNHSFTVFGPMFGSIPGTMSGRMVAPLDGGVVSTMLIGVPVCSFTMVFNCHPPRMA